MDLIAISQGLQAVQGMTNLVKTMVGLRDSAQLLEKTVELNQKILTVQIALSNAQSEQTSLIQTIRELEEKIAGFETWKAEKERYELKSLGGGALAYMLKPQERGSEPPHWVCTNCYGERRISPIQSVSVPGFGLRFRCPACKADLRPAPYALDGNDAKWLD